MSKKLKIKQINRTTLQQVRPVINEVFGKLSKKTNLTCSVGNISFDADSFTVSVTVAIADKKNKGKSAKEIKAAAEFVRACAIFGLKESDLGKKKMINGVEYELTGLAPRSPKYPILARNSQNGQTYKFTERSWK